MICAVEGNVDGVITSEKVSTEEKSRFYPVVCRTNVVLNQVPLKEMS